ncbi:helix-turn-helix transcriptional regulator [Peptoniphilus rhinitidis]|uniref:helix-turn-helix transcriptional regulator n=1 Tax=Peptoniphilus rhinitidis TaxID=1175452 RepID=UPI00204CEFC1|nr:helix-turn-helix transcriptional regulator [Peptoniphilus rhinitidis]MDU5594393.1 helix-turn-helix transcriptional regulator [Peptoniphilus rhinitidis]DAQ25318.1 MAG TPA: putative transcriptional regulator [Caudoviricetes sp.]
MNKVKDKRIEKNLTQLELANLVGVTPKYIGFIENGERNPSLQVAQKIAGVLDSTIEDIFLQSKCTKCT